MSEARSPSPNTPSSHGESGRKVRIILADDHKMIRDGIRAWIQTQPDFTIVDEAGDGRAAVQLAKHHQPDIVVMDVGMPDLNGIEATRQILEENPNIKIIGLSMHSEHKFVAQMLHAGASGYLLKECAVDELADAIKNTLDGQRYLSREITGVVVEDYVRRLDNQNQSSAKDVLSAREREVLQLLAEGQSVKEIAHKLHLSVKTIETHRQHIKQKLNIHTLPELTKFAIREGMTSLDT